MLSCFLLTNQQVGIIIRDVDISTLYCKTGRFSVKNDVDTLFFTQHFVPERHKAPDGIGKFGICLARR